MSRGQHLCWPVLMCVLWAVTASPAAPKGQWYLLFVSVVAFHPRTGAVFACWLVGCLTSQQHASVSQGGICLTSQQQASVSQGGICLTSQQHASVSQGGICLTSLQQASVSQGRICSDNCTCCHTEIEVADETFHLTQSQYTDTGPTSPSADAITPGAWQGSH